MTQHRFIRSFDLHRSELLIDDEDLIHQWQRVLRFEIGEKILLCNGKGEEATAEILSFTKKTCQVRLSALHQVVSEASRALTLYFSPLKRENTELILQKATEIGVVRFVPILCRRTIKQAINVERLQKILVEASEQSGRGVVPTLEGVQNFEQMIKNLSQENVPSVFFELEANRFSADSLQTQTKANLFIGPEGGWDPEEVADAERVGCLVRSLGITTLRAETAAIVACALAIQSF